MNQSARPAYAGIGSRKTPGEILSLMQELGQAFARQGWALRTGNCQGADQAFQAGANSVNPSLVELFLPWSSYEATHIRPGNAVYTPGSRAYAIAARHHPAWHRCGQAGKAMHARNVEIILGAGLFSPVSCLICWTPAGHMEGGTAQGIRVACAYGVPVFNLALPGGLGFADKLPISCWARLD